MLIGEIVKAAAEVVKETSKEMNRETKKIVKNLDKPLNASEINETAVLEKDDFEEYLKELDKPLNTQADVKEFSQIEDGADLLKDEDLAENGQLKNGPDEMQKLESREVSNPEVSNRQGGRFGDIFKEGEGDKIEVHHMPADSVTELPRNDGPAIRMDKSDHRETASCGNSREAREYREYQKKLIDEGKFDEAVKMDIDDIREKFGGKYDDAINEMLNYIDELKEAGKI